MINRSTTAILPILLTIFLTTPAFAGDKGQGTGQGGGYSNNNRQSGNSSTRGQDRAEQRRNQQGQRNQESNRHRQQNQDFGSYNSQKWGQFNRNR